MSRQHRRLAASQEADRPASGPISPSSSATLAGPFTTVVRGPGLRGLAKSGSERMLCARLEYTGTRQAARTLSLRDEGGGSVAWFRYHLWRVRTGLPEGIVLGREEDDLFGWALDVIDAAGPTCSS